MMVERQEEGCKVISLLVEKGVCHGLAGMIPEAKDKKQSSRWMNARSCRDFLDRSSEARDSHSLTLSSSSSSSSRTSQSLQNVLPSSGDNAYQERAVLEEAVKVKESPASRVWKLGMWRCFPRFRRKASLSPEQFLFSPVDVTIAMLPKEGNFFKNGQILICHRLDLKT